MIKAIGISSIEKLIFLYAAHGMCSYVQSVRVFNHTHKHTPIHTRLPARRRTCFDCKFIGITQQFDLQRIEHSYVDKICFSRLEG